MGRTLLQNGIKALPLQEKCIRYEKTNATIYPACNHCRDHYCADRRDHRHQWQQHVVELRELQQDHLAAGLEDRQREDGTLLLLLVDHQRQRTAQPLPRRRAQLLGHGEGGGLAKLEQLSWRHTHLPVQGERTVGGLLRRGAGSRRQVVLARERGGRREAGQGEHVDAEQPRHPAQRGHHLLRGQQRRGRLPHRRAADGGGLEHHRIYEEEHAGGLLPVGLSEHRCHPRRHHRAA